MYSRILAIGLCLAAVAGCSNKEAAVPAKQAPGKSLLVGLIPEQNIFRQMERYQPLADYLGRRIGAKVKLKVLPRYGNIIDNFNSEKLDGAFFGSFTYALAHAKLGVGVLARPVGLDNASTYHGLIFVRRDSGIRGVKGMRGKRFVFVDKATTAGYLLPLDYFHDAGISDYRKYVKESYFSGTHEDAVYDVLNRKADIGAAKNTVYEKLARSDSRIDKELLILAKSPDVPENGLALKKDISPAIRDGLKQTLLNMTNDSEGRKVLAAFGALRFIETTDRDYAPIHEYAEELRLNLANYDYMND